MNQPADEVIAMLAEAQRHLDAAERNAIPGANIPLIQTELVRADIALMKAKVAQFRSQLA